MREIVPRNQLVKEGTAGVFSLAGGGGVLLLSAFVGGGFSLLGLLLGGAVAFVGAAVSRDQKDRMVGLGIMAAGVLTAAASLPLIGGIGSFLLGASGIGLLGLGGYNLYRFYRGMRSRA